jgi:hypothetical protein
MGLRTNKIILSGSSSAATPYFDAISTEISSASTATQIPTAAAVYNAISSITTTSEIIKVGEIDYNDFNAVDRLDITVIFTDGKPINKLFVRGYMVIDEPFTEEYYYSEENNIIAFTITEVPVKATNIPNSAVRDIKCIINIDSDERVLINKQDWITGLLSIYIEVEPFPTLTE